MTDASSNLPLSEVYRITAKEWVEADAAASLLEETKSAVLSQHMKALGDIPVSKAELMVKSTADWHQFLTNMVEARKQANLLKVKLEWVRMRFMEWNSENATRRAEMKL